MADENPFKDLLAHRAKKTAEAGPEREEVKQEQSVEASQPKGRKRGRPATGKRSDPGWIGRTYYVKEETDIDVEMELALLRRQGVEVDKSELVNSLLDAWLKWRQGENSDRLMGKISPRRKGK
ncbi:hypothetical protein ACQ4N7_28430 [Nodosilinea sp. AN01ver1]|uniref:hypothetical protein n=1 Tax=Nodosilinea sp. AN01ver1 TaxID=3423362 RepID=UPI003D3149BA